MIAHLFALILAACAHLTAPPSVPVSVPAAIVEPAAVAAPAVTPPAPAAAAQAGKGAARVGPEGGRPHSGAPTGAPPPVDPWVTLGPATDSPFCIDDQHLMPPDQLCMDYATDTVRRADAGWSSP